MRNNLRNVYIRRGIAEDMPWMLDELQQLQVFFGSVKQMFHRKHSEDRLNVFLDHDLVLIAEKPSVGKIGLLIGVITPHIFNPEIKVLAEMLWWVTPVHRRTKAGYLLMKEYLRWGKENVDWITFSLQGNTPVKESTLNRFGFRHIEAAYLIEVGCENGHSSFNSSGSSDSSRGSNSLDN